MAIPGMCLFALAACQGVVDSADLPAPAAGLTQVELPATCGNGRVDPGEICDSAGAVFCADVDEDRYADGGAVCNPDCLGYNTELCVEKKDVDQALLDDLLQEEARNVAKEGPADTSGCVHPVTDFSQPGPFEVAQGSGPLGYSIYHPKTLGQNGCKHPIISWGNGTAVVGSLVYESFFKLWASHGFVVIAASTPMAGSGIEIRQGIDWYIQQNRAASSRFASKLSEKASSAGHSQGGIGASAAASHPSVVSVMNMEGCTALSKKPTFFLTGTLDFMNMLATMSYTFAAGPSVLGVVNFADHIASPTILGTVARSGPSVEFLRVTTAWFLCYLMGDQAACGFFKGPNSQIRNNPAWAKVDQKNM